MPDITANTVLPAVREPIRLMTSDGLSLVGEVAVPEDRPPTGTVVCLHPLPTHGGMMDSHVLRKASWRLPAMAGLAVLRFNTRGAVSAAGRSEGAFDSCVGEGRDLAAALDHVAERGLPDPWLLGWSFGTDVALRHGNVEPVRGALLLSPPLRWTTPEELDAWTVTGRPLTALIPQYDDFLPPALAVPRFARVPHAEVVTVPGAKHLWVGEPYVRIALDHLVTRVLPGSGPLPTQWDGPSQRWNDL